MQIPVSTQAEYDALIKSRKHIGNEIVIKDSEEFITVRTDVTVGKNGKCATPEKSEVKITAKENGIAAVQGKTTVTGYDNANIIGKGNCKIMLHDNAFGNCYGHCNITLKGSSKINADGNCTVHAYDETSVSATGNTKIYSYQSATAKGSDISTITARDNCLVYASDNCTVKASDNCLIVANQFAKIAAKDNCLVMSNNNPNDNIVLHDNCGHVQLENVTDKNIMGTLKQMAKSKAVAERPYIAIQVLKDNIPQQRKDAVNRRLNTMGLKDQSAAKDYLYRLIEASPSQKNQNPAFEKQLETARKAGYVQGVCECVKAVGNDTNIGKKLLTEMGVTKDTAKKFANPQLFKELEKSIFSNQQNQSNIQGFKR